MNSQHYKKINNMLRLVIQKTKKQYFVNAPKDKIVKGSSFWDEYFIPSVLRLFMEQFAGYMNQSEIPAPKLKTVICKNCMFWTPTDKQLRGVCGNRFFNRMVNNNGQNTTTAKFKCTFGKRISRPATK